MTTFRVWAPIRERVELALALDGAGSGAAGPASGAAGSDAGRPLERRPMARDDRGWWTLDVAAAGPGADYGYILDGEGPFADPRSASQPAGIHGLSRVVDPAGFAWSTPRFTGPALADAVIYEVHVGTFSQAGTFDAAIEHLDGLVELGISHVELMPVVEFPGDRGWGYDGVNLFAPHHAFGGPDGLKRLVDACHDRGLAVLLDVVYNHLGPDGNQLWRFGPYFSDAYKTPWGPALNFDGPGSDEVRSFVVDNALTWLDEYRIDGLRLDAVHAIYDQSALGILEELAAAVHALGARQDRRLLVIAESDLNDPRLVREVATGGYGLDGQWNDDVRHALHVTLTGESDRFHAQYDGLPDLATALREIFVLTGRYSAYRGRRHGRPAGDLPANRFVGFLQNHDHVGNRALGERSSALVAADALAVAAAIVLLGPFVPLLFQGEEWGASTPFLYFTDHQDPVLADAVREGRRSEFAHFTPADGEVPDPQAVETFERSRLDRSEMARPPHDRLLDWHRRLIAFRATTPALRDGSRPAIRFDAAERWLVMARGGIGVVANLAETGQVVPLEAGEVEGARLQLASAAGIEVWADSVALPGWSVAVLAPERGRISPR